jgi:hypothetical protein
MLEAIPLLAVTLVFISAFVYTVASTELNDIRNTWNSRRCEPVVMAMAQMVPIDGTKDAEDRSGFASDNFQFCMGRFIDASLGIFFAPVMKIFSSQLTNVQQVQGVVKNMNMSAASLMSPITSIFSTLFQKLQGVTYQVARIFYRLNSAFDRVFGIAAATVFAGASMIKGLQNTINYIIKVILIILSVLIILTIFLWFVLFPYVPIIVTTIAILASTVAGAAASGMAGAFCVVPGTLVGLQNNVWRPVEHLKPGDVLESGASIEGVLQTTGEGATLVSIEGVQLSSSHLVFDDVKGKWLAAEEHSLAQPSSFTTFKLFCLNTSDRCWSVRGTPTSPVIKIRDWEELPPETDIYNAYWEGMVYEMLNRQALHNTAGISVPGRGLLGRNTLVYEQSKGLIPLCEVQMGDFIQDNEVFTKVLGVYRDNSQLVPLSGPNGSAWIFYEGKRVWRHPLPETLFGNCQTFVKEGLHLITESGTFYANNERVRDFTEVGYNRIDRTYQDVLETLNNQNNFEQVR